MKPKDVTVEVLISIRDEIRSTRTELRSTRTELSERIEETNTRLAILERVQVQSEVRLATEVVALAGVIQDLRDDLRADRALRHRVEDLEQRVTRIEEHAPSSMP